MLKQITAIAISVAVGVGIGAWLMETPAEQPGMVEE